MTQCNATAELMLADMTVIPGITLRCELEAGHERYRSPEGDLDAGTWATRHLPGTDHAFTFRWHEVTTDELAEVLDPDESFDLEVDIADEAVLEQQQQAAVDNGEPVDERDYHQCPTCRGLVCTCSDAVRRTRTCEHCGSLLGLAAGVWRHPDDELASACSVGNVRV